MSFKDYRAAIIADAKKELVPLPFRTVRAAPRRIGDDWFKQMLKVAPSIHISFLGSDSVGRSSSGELTGPWQIVFHVVTRALSGGNQTPDDSLLEHLSIVAEWVEGRTFDYPGAMPCQVHQIENVWDVQLKDDGYAVGFVALDQHALFGRNLVEEEIRRLGPPRSQPIR
jgi:hypothetical protein